MGIRRRAGLAAGLSVVLALVLAGCGAAAESAVEPTEAARAAAEPTDVAPTAPEPTEVAPVEAGAEGEMPVPGDTPVPEMIVTVEPSVTVTDQAIVEGRVTIAEVASEGPGWLVVHADDNGAPGPILGYAPVVEGANRDVAVQVDLSGVTSRLYAMLHQDAGTVGTWEFPGGADLPVTVDGQVVSPVFRLQALAGDEAEIEMADYQFQPRTLVVRVGTEVKWSNKDEAAHTTTSDTGLWDSGYLDQGDDFAYTFAEPGTYPYYCIPHGGPGGQGMSGVVIVVE